MATSSTRALWKGAISFGLVHIPVALHSAIEDTRPKMRMVEAETMAPIGHANINKQTGEKVNYAEITKALEFDRGRMVALTKEEIREALPKTVGVIEIEAFIEASKVPLPFFSKPYYVSPLARGGKPYALLREVLRRTGRVGLGRVVISTKQHFALVAPFGDALLVELLRWSDEVRETAGLPLPGDIESLGITDRELRMGEQLVLELDAADWGPERFVDVFRQKLEALVEKKRAAGEVFAVAGAEPGEAIHETGEVVDLAELLRQSLRSTSAANAPAARVIDAANDAPAPKRRAAAKRADGSARTSAPAKPRKRAP